jgi:hypothetical protein
MAREEYYKAFRRAEHVRAQKQKEMFEENLALAQRAFPEGSLALSVKGYTNSIVEVLEITGSWWADDMRACVRNPKTGEEYVVALHYLGLPEGEEFKR